MERPEAATCVVVGAGRVLGEGADERKVGGFEAEACGGIRWVWRWVIRWGSERVGVTGSIGLGVWVVFGRRSSLLVMNES